MTAHTVTVTRETAACCDRHSTSVARCSCGWFYPGIHKASGRHHTSEPGETGEAILRHRVAALEDEVGMKFEVKHV